MGEHKWIGSSLRHLSAELKDMDHAASRMTVGRLLRKPDYSLKANVKRLSGPAHPDRGHQFEYSSSILKLTSKPILRQTYP